MGSGLMGKQMVWDWQRYLTENEAARLNALSHDADALRERLDAIHGEEDAICRAAIGRAKAAGAKVVPFKL